jgi:exosortase/archaeosortase family protein
MSEYAARTESAPSWMARLALRDERAIFVVIVGLIFAILVLPPLADGKPNQVGVAEACSGIRSLTACLFAGSFLASVFLDKLWKKTALVAASMLFAVFTNLLRGLFLTAWAYNYGHEAIEGFVHDVAGYAVLGLTVVGLLCLLPLFNLKITFSDDDEAAGAPPAGAAGA